MANPAKSQRPPVVADVKLASSENAAPGLLALGVVAEKILSYAEHFDFLVSIRGEKFKMIYEFWDSAGWVLALLIAIAWGAYRYIYRESLAKSRSSAGMMVVVAFLSFIVGVFYTVNSSSVFPNIIIASSSQWTPMSNGTTHIDPCNVQVDMAPLTGFSDKYKFAVACVLVDPSKDEITQKTLFVSTFYDIRPQVIVIEARQSPGGDFNINAPNMTFNRYPILVPKSVEWVKITTLGDLIQLGGKILSPQYYSW